jgi:hypothetical protein
MGVIVWMEWLVEIVALMGWVVEEGGVALISRQWSRGGEVATCCISTDIIYDYLICLHNI